MKLFTNLFNKIDSLDQSIYECFLILESIGIFPDCEKIVDYIIDKLSKIKNYNKDIIIKPSDIGIKNIFFKQITIIFDKKDNPKKSPKAQCKSNDFDNDEQLIENIFIKLYINHFNISNTNFLQELLTHELTHAWDYYIVSKNFNYEKYKGKSEKEIQKIKYDKTSGKISINNKEEAHAFQYIVDTIIGKDENGNIKCDDFIKNDKLVMKYNNFYQTIEDIFYYLIKTEENAFIAALEPGLHKKTFNSIKDAINYLNENSRPYKAYKYIYHLANDNNGQQLKDLDFSNSFIKKIQKETEKIWKRIIHHSYLACEKHIKK